MLDRAQSMQFNGVPSAPTGELTTNERELDRQLILATQGGLPMQSGSNLVFPPPKSNRGWQ